MPPPLRFSFFAAFDAAADVSLLLLSLSLRRYFFLYISPLMLIDVITPAAILRR